MNKIIISYDLIKPEKDYPKLFEYLESFPWAKPLRSFWIIKTNKSVVIIRNEIQNYIDNNDKVFIAEMGSWAAFNIPQEVADWLKRI